MAATCSITMAFLTFSRPEAASACVDALNGQCIPRLSGDMQIEARHANAHVRKEQPPPQQQWSRRDWSWSGWSHWGQDSADWRGDAERSEDAKHVQHTPYSINMLQHISALLSHHPMYGFYSDVQSLGCALCSLQSYVQYLVCLTCSAWFV